MKKNTAGQKWVVFAFDETDNTPKAGDAAQITAKVSIDGGAAGATTDVNPTELESGYYAFDIDADETNGDYLAIIPVSSTGNIQVVGVPGGVWTTFPVESADSGSTQIARVGADGDTLEDISDEIASLSTDVADIPTVAEFEARTIVSADYVVVGDTIAGVTLVTTTTTNSDMVGTNSAALASVLGAAVGASISADIAAVKAETASIQTETTALDTLTKAAGDGDLAAVLLDTAEIGTAGAGLTDITINAASVTAVWAKAMSDLAQGAPSATASVLVAINYLYEFLRNKTTTTATLITVMKDDGSTGLVKSTISDDGTTFTKAEFITGA